MLDIDAVWLYDTITNIVNKMNLRLDIRSKMVKKNCLKAKRMKKQIPIILAMGTVGCIVVGNSFMKAATCDVKAAINMQVNEIESDSIVNDLKYGDVNGDGEINISDGVVLKKHLAGIKIEMNKTTSDVNLDGSVDISDAVLIMKHLAGMNVGLGEAQQPTKPDNTKPDETKPNETKPSEEDEYFVYPHDPDYPYPTDLEISVNETIREIGLKKGMSRAEIITTYLMAEYNAFKDWCMAPEGSAEKEEKEEKWGRYNSYERYIFREACGIPCRFDSCWDNSKVKNFDFIITTMENGTILYSDIYVAKWDSYKTGKWDINDIILLVSQEEMYQITAEKYGCVWTK